MPEQLAHSALVANCTEPGVAGAVRNDWGGSARAVWVGLLLSSSQLKRLMKTEADWAHQAKGLLKGELKRRNVAYQALSDSLRAMGVNETPKNIANKISRGKFTAVFFLQCMEAIGARTFHLNGE